MKRIRKPQPNPHRVFIDSSTLWFADKSEVVDPKFSSFWNDYSDEFSFELLVPEVVRGELLYQHTNPALSKLQQANTAIQAISAITEKTYRHRVTEIRIHMEVESRLDNWISSRMGKIISTPIENINWSSIVEAAIWRKPPFISKDKAEKGFRDALIIETVVDYCTNDNKAEPIVFLCKDRLLRETVVEKLSHDDRFTAYEFIADFISYLDLTKEALEEKFIHAIVRRATEKFFKRNDPKCLYHRDNIREMLEEKHKTFFEDPQISDSATGLLSGLPGILATGTTKEWVPISQGGFWIFRPQFKSVENGNIYHWQSTLTFVQQYIRGQRGMPSALLPPTYEKERLLILSFQVFWKARVISDGRFLEYDYVSDELTDNEFRALTDDDRESWNLQSIES